MDQFNVMFVSAAKLNKAADRRRSGRVVDKQAAHQSEPCGGGGEARRGEAAGLRHG